MYEAPGWDRSIWCRSWESLTIRKRKWRRFKFRCVTSLGVYVWTHSRMLKTEPHVLNLDPLSFSPEALLFVSRRFPKELASLGCSFCALTPLSGALILVWVGWWDRGTSIHSLPLWGSQSCWVCQRELGEGEEGRHPVPSSVSWALRQSVCVCLDFLKFFLQLLAPFLFFFFFYEI